MTLNMNHIRGAMNRANLRTMQTDFSIVYTINDPAITPDGTITIADGSAATVAELLEFCEEIVAMLENAGIAT